MATSVWLQAAAALTCFALVAARSSTAASPMHQSCGTVVFEREPALSYGTIVDAQATPCQVARVIVKRCGREGNLRRSWEVRSASTSGFRLVRRSLRQRIVVEVRGSRSSSALETCLGRERK